MIEFVILIVILIFLYFLFQSRQVKLNPTFETDIKPLFRQFDIDAMEGIIDFTDYDDVKKNADKIYNRVALGDMPCDGGWNGYKVKLFQNWMKSGYSK
jgi:hypothetical protein